MIQALRTSAVGKSLLLLFGIHVIVDFFSGIWPIYKTLSGIDVAKAGLIAGVTGFLGESLQLFFGFFCDKGYRRHILIFGFLLSSSILFITFFQGFLFYFALLFLLRIGSAAFHPAGIGYVGSLTEEHKSKTILFFSSGGLLGLACSQVIFTQILQRTNGHGLILFIPFFLMAAILSFHRFPSVKVTSNMTVSGLLETFKKQKKTLGLLYLTQLTSYSLVLSLIFLLPDLLAVKTQSAWLKMGGGHFCYIVGGAATLPVAGFLCDQYNQKTIMLTAIVLTLGLYYCLTFSSYLSGLQGGLLLFALGGALNSINPMIVSWGIKTAPDNPSSVSALLIGGAWCFSNLGPAGAGFIYKTFGVNPEMKTFATMGLILLLSLSFASLTPRPKTQRSDQRVRALR